TATRRPPRPRSSIRAEMVMPSATDRVSPLSSISMAPLSPIRTRSAIFPASAMRWRMYSAVGLADAPIQEESMSPRRLIPTVLASALALAAAPALAADGQFSRTVFFGDSLTDGGFFRPLLPPGVQPVTGQFTTNPGWVWAQYLAERYGNDASANGNGQSGDNYAVGGARVAQDVFGALGPTPSVASQVQSFIGAGGVDPDALYSVWGGANDVFAIAGG